MSADALPYRPCAGVLLFNQTGQVFVAKRLDTDAHAWQLPQGGIDKGEEPLEAAIRELEEETGVTSATLIGEAPNWLTYDLPEELLGKVWKGRYRGQKQRWFAFRFTGQDSEINIETRHPEFSDWKWTDLEKIPDEIVPFKKTIYLQLVEIFTPLVRQYSP